MEHPKRTLVKTLTWRVIAFVTTMAVVYMYSRDLHESLVVGVGANLLKMFFYYAHERVWNRIDYGRLPPPDYQI